MNLFNDNSNKYIDINIKIPWVEKYRPKNSEEILIEPFIKDKINNILLNKSIPNMIITGEPGTGKTSTILFLAKEIYKNFYNDNVLELNASDERGIRVVREKIKTFSQKATDDDFKVIILDEVDSMTLDGQFALRRIIENYTENTRFCLICNYITKITPALRSRCLPFRFEPLNTDFVLDKLYDIMDKENVDLEDEIVDKIVEKSNGDLRKSINMLQCLTTFTKVSKNDDIGLLFNMVDLKDIDIILNELKGKNSFVNKFKKIKKLINDKEYNLTEIIQYIINLLIEKKDINKNIIKELSKLELKTYNNLDNDLIISSLIGTFILLK